VTHTVTVTGAGSATAPPDLAVVRLRADALRENASEAVAAAADAVRRVREALAEQAGGLHADSTSLTLHAEESWGPDPATGRNRRRRDGFRAGHGLVVRSRDVEGVGALLAALLAAGGDDLALDGLEHVVADAAALRSRARTLAWDDARARADQHAAQAGRTLGTVLEVSEGVAPGGPRPLQVEVMRGAEAADVGSEPGGVEVGVQVRVTWQLG
jgi:uncharacterized protein YggE